MKDHRASPPRPDGARRQGVCSVRNLESTILREIKGVLLGLCTGYSFVARQKRMSVGRTTSIATAGAAFIVPLIPKSKSVAP